MTDFRIGPFRFQYIPDGDDPGVGLMRVTLEGAEAELGCSREQWDEFVDESGPERLQTVEERLHHLATMREAIIDPTGIRYHRAEWVTGIATGRIPKDRW